MSMLMVTPRMETNGTSRPTDPLAIIQRDASSSDVADRVRDLITLHSTIDGVTPRLRITSVTLDVHDADDVPLFGGGFIYPDVWREDIVLPVHFTLDAIEHVHGRRVATYSIEQMDVPPPSHSSQAGPDLAKRARSKRRLKPTL